MIKSIMCCCGSGLGSSMLVRMNVEKTLQKIGVSGVSVTHSSLSDAAEGTGERSSGKLYGFPSGDL